MNTEEPNGHDFEAGNEADVGQTLLTTNEAAFQSQQENDAALCGHTIEEVSEMFAEVMAANPDALNSIGTQTQQVFSDTQRQDAEAYDVDATNLQLNEKILAVSNMVVNLLAEIHAHLAHEYNRAVILEQEELRQELIMAEAPRWYSKAADKFQESFMDLRRCLNQRSGF